MSAPPRLVAVGGAFFSALLEPLDAGLRRGRRRGLLQMAKGSVVTADDLRRELAAFTGLECAAVVEGPGLSAAKCVAGRGCPVEAECPLVQGRGREGLEESVVARLVRSKLQPARRQDVEPAPADGFAELRQQLERLLATQAAGSSPARSRTSLVLLDLAIGRGAPPGAGTAYLTGEEFEQLAAYLPPASSRRVPELADTEAWIRRVATSECAVVELQ